MEKELVEDMINTIKKNVGDDLKKNIETLMLFLHIDYDFTITPDDNIIKFANKNIRCVHGCGNLGKGIPRTDYYIYNDYLFLTHEFNDCYDKFTVSKLYYEIDDNDTIKFKWKFDDYIKFQYDNN